MNERIRQLAEQSEITQYIAAHNKYLERFAELIVRECFTKLTPYLDDQFIGDIESELKEHFGVEK